jgi:hypothetical protein
MVPSEAPWGDILEGWTPENRQSGGEIALGGNRAVLEVGGEILRVQKKGIFPGKANPGGMKVSEFLADFSEVFEELGPEDVCFALVLP